MADKLGRYNEKRNFDKTGEPKGRTEEPGGHLRFVVQHHLASRDHFDFRLEWGGALLSWAVPKGPSYKIGDKRLAVHVEDHPLEYRNFEGTIPKGEYGGGIVMLWDEGTWEPYGDVDKGLDDGSLKFSLMGKRLKGKWALVRMKPKERESGENWLLLKEKDEYAGSETGISQFTTSIRTGRTMEEIEGGEKEKFVKNPFQKVEVQLAKLADKVPEGDEWLYELKYDGYRIVAYIEGNNARLMTRNGNDYTDKFRDAAVSLIDLAGGRAMVLDGEMVIAGEGGKTDFQALQSYMKKPEGKKLTYMIFDLLALDGQDLRGHPLTERKNILENLLKNAPKNLSYSQHVRGKGKESFAAACKLKMEGIVGKKADSLYTGTRNGDWIKLKCENRQEFVIGGYTVSDKKTNGISSLLLGVYEGNDLIYVGRAGTGLSVKDMKDLENKFRPAVRDTSAFQQPPKPKSSEKFIWLSPIMAAEIRFAEWTGDNFLRQASFKGLRTDKNPLEIRREVVKMPLDDKPDPKQQVDKGERIIDKKGSSITVEGIKISNPDKVIFDDPVITKADVVRYYSEVADRMLPYVSGRILSIVRCPKGISESCFYKKHPGSGSKGIVTVPVKNSDGEEEEYFYIENKAGLIYEAQMGTLEFHPWGSRAYNMEKPDIMVFDLDPDEGMDLQRVRQGVRDLKSILDGLSLRSYLKTSGGKGYHVVVPFQPSAQWDVFHDFAKRIAEAMEQQWPDRYTSNVRKEKRKNKIFIDWIRNGRGATSIAPYSLRARKGATVSIPISWDELDTVGPGDFHMEDVQKRIAKADPWKDFFKTDQKLK